MGRSSDFIVRIFSYDNRIIHGRIEDSSHIEWIEFHGLMSFIEAIQVQLDENGFPDATMALRQWDLKTPATASYRTYSNIITTPAGQSAKPLASFLLHIQFRQNAGWQGKLAWLEQKRTMAFRSVLELSSLIDQALLYTESAARAAPAARPQHKWKNKESVS